MHVFSTLFTAQSVDKDFRDEAGIKRALDWCRASQLTKVYIESFRDGLFIEQDLLEKVRDRFQAEGYTVHGCVTTTGLPKPSASYKEVGCYSHLPNLELIERIFRRTAAVFDTIMIDDFLFTDCACAECDKARGGRSFDDYHSDVMHEMSVERILRPAHEVNPICKVIIKYPLWYENFHKRGYDTLRQTRDFDLIWGGTETREPDSERWGRYPQTQAFYMMAWDMKLGGAKCGGGWYDPYTTTPPTYLEQARETILAGAKESMLFCYRSLQGEAEGAANTEALRDEMDGLHQLAYLICGKALTGVSVPKKPDDDARSEAYLSSFYSMLGIPVVPDVDLDPQAQSVILGAQAAGYADARGYARDLLAAGKAVAFSEGFLAYTGFAAPEGAPVFAPGADNWSLMDLPQQQLDALRNTLLAPLGASFYAPSRVALNFYDADMEIIRNFNNHPVTVQLSLPGRDPKARKLLLTLSKGRDVQMEQAEGVYTLTLPPRTLAVLG